jgi:hypothetical protein
MKNKDSDRLASMGSFFANIETAARRHLAGRPLIPCEDEAAFELFEELKSRGKWPAKESVADWYGKSGDRWVDAAGEFKRAVLRKHDAELMTRHEVHENPPDLLITNYSMLEYRRSDARAPARARAEPRPAWQGTGRIFPANSEIRKRREPRQRGAPLRHLQSLERLVVLDV